VTVLREPLGADTLAVAVPDNIGRLIGKRLPIDRYDDVLRSGLSMPDFHLVTGIDNEPREGLAAAGVQLGFRNGVLRLDEETLRPLPWEPGTALVLADPFTAEGAPAGVAPRWVLRRQVERLAGMGLTARCATELEFYLYRGSYAENHDAGFHRLVPAYHLGADNDLLVSGWVEDVVGEIRRQMPLAGIPVEATQGEGGLGQHEVALEHAPPLEAADRHVVYKHGVRDIAARAGYAATFMAKVNVDQAGSSCHIHISIARDGASALADRDGLTPFGGSFLAGLLAFTRELMPLHAPYANSYRRLTKGSWAPANETWGFDNRTTCVRALGSGLDFRFEFRVPGADANPYLSLAALLAAGLEGVERRLEPPAPTTGDAYAAAASELPGDLTEAVAAFSASEVAADAFGRGVRDHYTALAIAERDEGRRAVTDWDLRRGFERA
jgi:glutamine synthetase